MFDSVYIYYSYIYIYIYIYIYKRSTKNNIIILLLFIVSLILGKNSNNELFQNYPYYVFGIYLSLKQKNIVFKSYDNKLKLLSILIIVIIFIMNINTNKYYVLNVIFRCFVVATTWIAFDNIDYNMHSFYKNSFFIYMIHEIILEVIEKLLFLLFDHNEIFALIDYFLAPAITLLIIYIIYRFLLLFPKTMSLLTGARIHKT